jgi:ribosomal protein S18 acetylase RimI-like enzyme
MELKEVIKQARQIWETIFGDSKEFVKQYFDFVGHENIIYLEDSSRIYGFLLIPNYDFSIFGKTIKAHYISGLCVANDERSKGNGKLLVRNAIYHSYESGAAVMFLVAADNDLMQFYQQFGFGHCCVNSRRVFKMRDINDVFLETHQLDFNYKTFLRNYDCGDIQSRKFLLHKRETLDLYFKSGYTFVNLVDDEEEEFSPGAILIDEDEFVNVVELNVKNLIQKTILLSLIADRYEKDVHYKEPFKEYNSEGIYMDIFNKSKRDINQMMRIIDAETCLRIFAENHPFIDVLLRIEDDLIRHNNITAWIKDGELIVFENPDEVPGQREIKDINIKRLTTMCFTNTYLTLLFDQ